MRIPLQAPLQAPLRDASSPKGGAFGQYRKLYRIPESRPLGEGGCE